MHLLEWPKQKNSHSTNAEEDGGKPVLFIYCWQQDK